MTAQVDFLGLLFIIWGFLTMLIGVSTLALGIGAAALMATASRASEGAGQFAAGLTAVLFITLAICAIIWGAAHVAVGVPLRRHTHWSRLAGLSLGSIDLVLLPYGTALGIYALYVLLNEKGRALFQPTV